MTKAGEADLSLLNLKPISLIVVIGRLKMLRAGEFSGKLSGIMDQDRQVLGADAYRRTPVIERDEGHFVGIAVAGNAPLRAGWVVHNILSIFRKNRIGYLSGWHRPARSDRPDRAHQIARSLRPN